MIKLLNSFYLFIQKIKIYERITNIFDFHYKLIYKFDNIEFEFNIKQILFKKGTNKDSLDSKNNKKPINKRIYIC